MGFRLIAPRGNGASRNFGGMGHLLITSVALVGFSCGAFASPPQNESERTAALQSLQWKDGEVLKLPLSRGTLKAPANIKQLSGADAATLYGVLNGVDAPFGTEAALYDPHAETLVFYQKIGDGFVKLDDWDDIDADAMLKTVSENTETANAKRKVTGISPLHVVGWLERPQLERSTSTVRWSFEATDEQSGPLVNSVMLVLGRDGFEKLTWIGPKTAVNDGLLNVAQDSFNFPTGGLYADFKSGDKVAEYGIAGLVAAVLGVKLAAKLGLLAAVVIFAKKFGVIAVVAIGALLGRFRKVFSRQKNIPPPSPPPAA